MKILTTIVAIGCVFYAGTTMAQNVNIPDANFKAYLVGNSSINTNGDSEIQVSEAAAFTGTINCSNQSISDMTGIESFINLSQLNCYNNSLSNLDVSNNTNLTHLQCYNNSLSSLDVSNNANLMQLYFHNNQISSLDVSNNTNLTQLYCQSNQISSLDVSNNANLTRLYCHYNQISNLDLSNNTNLTQLRCNHNQLGSLVLSSNTALTALHCQNNQISSMDLSNNVNLGFFKGDNNQLSSLNIKNGNNSNMADFNAANNPNLQCIEVDDSTYSANNWLNIDAIATFSTDCSLYNSTTTINNGVNIRAYPNPTSQNIRLEFGQLYEHVQIQVTDLRGQVVLDKTIENAVTTTTELPEPTGIYFVAVKTANETRVLKVVKE
ncbi:T9SS type A sorting domain-containing protein [Aureispira sp. CCB-QB1]|uniref:T9SS type A sorting domain-containing protein n=1 Tax=Aureispira sp. CCB-QB1 TaxID=1313421 RepID=UPI000698BFA1|nr:T9SS type A sorting domain-containing protein [Aureispira sp. CCB-QB1]